MALKRQQAVEDAIALRLAYNETGATMEVLPPGKIFGMNVTDPCAVPAAQSTSSSAVVLDGGVGGVCSGDIDGTAHATDVNGGCHIVVDHKPEKETAMALTQRKQRNTTLVNL